MTTLLGETPELESEAVELTQAHADDTGGVSVSQEEECEAPLQDEESAGEPSQDESGEIYFNLVFSGTFIQAVDFLDKQSDEDLALIMRSPATYREKGLLSALRYNDYEYSPTLNELETHLRRSPNTEIETVVSELKTPSDEKYDYYEFSNQELFTLAAQISEERGLKNDAKYLRKAAETAGELKEAKEKAEDEISKARDIVNPLKVQMSKDITAYGKAVKRRETKERKARGEIVPKRSARRRYRRW